MTAYDPRARHQVLGIVALALFAALLTRLWFLQVLTAEDYDLAARSTRTRTVIIEAPRGRILDRSGKVLVENRRTIQVTVDYQDFVDLDDPTKEELLRNLARELTADDLARYQGMRDDTDPGAVADEPVAPVADEDEGTGATTEPSSSDEGGEQDEGGDEDEETGPYADEGPPAGVATGADNPDGQGEADDDAPDPVTEEMLLERIDDPRFSKFKPVPVATGVSEELEVYLRENAERFPTVAVQRVTVRQYRYGALLAHVLGYVGSITEEEFDEFQNDDKPYENDDDIGKAGIERAMEHELRGTPGEIVYEVDARNRPVGDPVSETPAVPGRDVYLTIDINLQYLTEVGLAAEAERRRGRQDSRGCGGEDGCTIPGAASVSIDPRNGEVLTMASYPTYDPNLFVGGISTADYEAIASDERIDIHHQPLLNRAIGGQYAPGSTFKLFSAFAGLDNGITTPDEPFNDTGVWAFSTTCDTSIPSDQTNCYAQNSGRAQHGTIRLTEALTLSSDTYFYRLGDHSWRRRGTIGEEAMQDSMREWGLGERTGIDLPGKRTGRIPTPAWLWEFSHAINDDPEMAEEAGTWNAGISGNTMVGQGDVLLTPLQIAQGYATLANGGTIWRPRLVLQVTDYGSEGNVVVPDPEPVALLDLPTEWRDPMVAGFDGVTKYPGGTATTGFSEVDQSACPVAGKTGTAQVDRKADTSLFASFAPTPTDGRESVIATATVFEEAGFGSDAAVPLTVRVLQPFIAMGCDIRAFGAAGSPHTAPEGGWFDVEHEVETFVPPVSTATD